MITVSEWARACQSRGFADVQFSHSKTLQYLQDQVRHRTGRSVLIHGPSGCGKTMHATWYANALICDGLEDRPCFECDSCRFFKERVHPNALHFEHDGEEGAFARIVNAKARTESLGEGRLVVIVDRPELMPRRELEMMRDRMGGADPKITFICCTEDILQVDPAIRDYFYPLQVRRPTQDDARAYLISLCDAAGLHYEEEMISVLAQEGRSYRHLRLLLERCRDGVGLCSRRVASVSEAANSTRYLRAAFEGESIERQLAIISEWNELPSIVIDSVGKNIAALSFSDTDPRLKSSYVAPDELVSAFNRSVSGKYGRVFLNSALKIWQPIALANEAALYYRVVEFERLLRSMVSADSGDIKKLVENWIADDVRVKQFKSHLKGSSGRTSHGTSKRREGGKFLQLNEIKRIWNAASFLVQVYGELFTTKLTIRHSVLKLIKPRAPSVLINELVREMRQRFDDPEETSLPTLHWIYRYRTDEFGEQLTEFIINFDKNGAARARHWLSEKFIAVRHEGLVSDKAVVLRHTGATHVHHLDLVRWMCAAIKPDRSSASLMARLGIEAKNNIELGSPFTVRRIGLSHGLTESSAQRARIDLRVLPAFELAGRAESGWEMREFAYRMEIRRKYAEYIRQVEDGSYSEHRTKQLGTFWTRGEPARHAKRPTWHHS